MKKLWKINPPKVLLLSKYFESGVDHEGDEWGSCKFATGIVPGWLGDVIVLYGYPDMSDDLQEIVDCEWDEPAGSAKSAVQDLRDLNDKALRAELKKKGGVITRIPDYDHIGVFLVWVGASKKYINTLMRSQYAKERFDMHTQRVKNAAKFLTKKCGVDEAKRLCHEAIDEALVEGTHEQ